MVFSSIISKTKEKQYLKSFHFKVQDIVREIFVLKFEIRLTGYHWLVPCRLCVGVPALALAALVS